jgi:hypothetical protein
MKPQANPRRTGSTKKLEHYLVSIALGPADMHGYVMTSERSDTSRVMNRMMDEAEKFADEHRLFLLPMILQTGPLQPETVTKIREFLCTRNAAHAQVLGDATDFHFTIWMMGRDEPFNKTLMEEVH